MDQKAIIGLGVSVVLLCVRYRFPVVPKSVAWAGVAAGLGIFAMAVFSLRLGPALLSIAGLAMLAGGLSWQLDKPSPEPAALPVVEPGGEPKPVASQHLPPMPEPEPSRPKPTSKPVVRPAAQPIVTNSVQSVSSTDQQGGITAGNIGTVNQGTSDERQ